MGVETKKMTKSAALISSADDSFGGRLKSWPDRIKNFYQDVRTEMKHVSAPPLKEVQATTVVVIITVILFGVYFAVVDYLLRNSVDWLLHLASRH